MLDLIVKSLVNVVVISCYTVIFVLFLTHYNKRWNWRILSIRSNRLGVSKESMMSVFKTLLNKQSTFSIKHITFFCCLFSLSFLPIIFLPIWEGAFTENIEFNFIYSNDENNLLYFVLTLFLLDKLSFFYALFFKEGQVFKVKTYLKISFIVEFPVILLTLIKISINKNYSFFELKQAGVLSLLNFPSGILDIVWLFSIVIMILCKTQKAISEVSSKIDLGDKLNANNFFYKAHISVVNTFWMLLLVLFISGDNNFVVSSLSEFFSFNYYTGIMSILFFTLKFLIGCVLFSLLCTIQFVPTVKTVARLSSSSSIVAIFYVITFLMRGIKF